MAVPVCRTMFRVVPFPLGVCTHDYCTMVSHRHLLKAVLPTFELFFYIPGLSCARSETCFTNRTASWLCVFPYPKGKGKQLFPLQHLYGQSENGRLPDFFASLVYPGLEKKLVSPIEVHHVCVCFSTPNGRASASSLCGTCMARVKMKDCF